MALLRRLVILFAFAAIWPSGSHAQVPDLYDPTVLRSFQLSFHDDDWLDRLRANYASQTPILADLEVDGVAYPSVGVRIRGNTSYLALPAGSEKFSLKILMDHAVPGQSLLGYSNLNLNNGFRDPTFSREVVYNNFVAQFIPNPRANHVLVTLNGQNWGVYINVQQPNKRMLRDYFADADGLRIICANNPSGPGLRYQGPNPADYPAYEIQDDGGLADPYGALIAVADALTRWPLDTWPDIDGVFAIDPSIWSVVLENLLTDDDSYVNKGCDFLTYRNPVDGRMHLLQRDANETFAQPDWAITRNFELVTRPVLSRLLSVPELRQRYMAHYRTVRQDLSWDYFGPLFEAQRSLIDAAVQADPKKLYPYSQFLDNFTFTVFMPLPGLGGGNIVGLRQFVESRASFLDASEELLASGPAILAVAASASQPAAAQPVWIAATVAPDGSPVASVELFYRPHPDGVYLRVPMHDDGESGDGAAGDGVYGALLPVAGVGGQRVAYYVAATSDNAFASLSFQPALAERGPLFVDYAAGSIAGLRITEWMYQGGGGEFIEFTNLGEQPVDASGWSMDDDRGRPGGFDLSAFGTIQPGESAVVTESDAEAFRLDWGLPPETKILGGLGDGDSNNFGRNDQINLFDAFGGLVDRLDYGDQDYSGSIRTQNRSGQAPCSAIGGNDVFAWELSAVGDAYGSFAAASGDIGSPGSFADTACVIRDPSIFGDGFE